jgi:hypothetical protein
MEAQGIVWKSVEPGPCPFLLQELEMGSVSFSPRARRGQLLLPRRVRGWDREVVGRWEREVDLVQGGALVCIIVAIYVFAQGAVAKSEAA